MTLLPKISNTWDLIIEKDGKKNTVKHDFHIKCKDTWRKMFDSDPEATGSSLKMLSLLLFDVSYTKRDPKESPQPNELFIEKMVEDYNKKYKQLSVNYFFNK